MSKQLLKPPLTKNSNNCKAITNNSSIMVMLKCSTSYYMVILTWKWNYQMPSQASKRTRKLGDHKLLKPSKQRLLQCCPCRILCLESPNRMPLISKLTLRPCSNSNNMLNCMRVQPSSKANSTLWTKQPLHSCHSWMSITAYCKCKTNLCSISRSPSYNNSHSHQYLKNKCRHKCKRRLPKSRKR